MVDVFHYLFEADHDYSTGEQAEAQTNFRTSIYRELYSKEYKYGYRGSKNKNQMDSSKIDFDEPVEPEALVKPFNPRQNSPTGIVKPYVRPTDPSALGNVLDGSLN